VLRPEEAGAVAEAALTNSLRLLARYSRKGLSLCRISLAVTDAQHAGGTSLEFLVYNVAELCVLPHLGDYDAPVPRRRPRPSLAQQPAVQSRDSVFLQLETPERGDDMDDDTVIVDMDDAGP
jgi:hypothetical protein